MLAIQLKKEKNSLKQIMGQQYVSNNQKQTEYYLINKNYTNELNKMLYKFNQIIEKCQEENEIDFLQIIKSKLNNELINKINKLSREKIQKQLDNREFNELKISYANNEEQKGVCFYQNFDIISKEMVDILKKIDINIDSKLIKVSCIFHNYKIIMLLNKNLINIYYYFNTDEITIQYIIMTEKTVKLFNMLLNQGYNFIEKYLPYNKVDMPIIYNYNKFDTIPIRIYKIINGNKVEFRISDKLKTLLLMAYSQIKLYDNNSHEVYLINPQWLKQYKYNDISNLISEKHKKIQNLNIAYNDLNSVFEILKCFINKQNKLMNFDNELVFISPNQIIPFNYLLEEIKLENKSLLLFKEFVIVDKQILTHIKRSFGIIPSKKNISYIYKTGEGDLIIVKEYPLFIENQNRVEKLILFGKY